ncbi:sensor histidine kinase [Streptomyces sp. NPDC058625]|uniref:sensor histidine kinase n=1 Tax=Streptomyces sp. NPDC058625 TaxID=3346564 RepID=UPI0036545DDF
MVETAVSSLVARGRVVGARWRALGATARDAAGVVLLAPVVCAPVSAPLGAEFGDLAYRPYDALSVLVTVGMWAPLALRRWRPGACLVLVASAFTAYELLGCPQTLASAGLYVALYGAGAHSERADGARLALAATAGTGLYVLLALGLHRQGSPQRVPDFVLIFLTLVACWAVGRTVRAWQAGEAERRRLGAEAATAQERARIARELHDVVTHHVTAMVVQADAAGFLLADAPDRVAAGLGAISDSGRHALTDLQHLLGVLKASGGEPGGGPGDGAGDGAGTLADLVARTRAAGQPVELTELTEPTEPTERPHPPDVTTPTARPGSKKWPMPSAVELAAYRVVQEALTNALKHAPGHGTSVRVRYGPHEVEVEVITEGAPAGPAAAGTGVPHPRRLDRGGGHGLVGLRERVSVFGGELQAGRRPDGGFGVRARIPFGGHA